jgi:hypothetical protein
MADDSPSPLEEQPRSTEGTEETIGRRRRRMGGEGRVTTLACSSPIEFRAFLHDLSRARMTGGRFVAIGDVPGRGERMALPSPGRRRRRVAPSSRGSTGRYTLSSCRVRLSVALVRDGGDWLARLHLPHISEGFDESSVPSYTPRPPRTGGMMYETTIALNIWHRGLVERIGGTTTPLSTIQRATRSRERFSHCWK